MAYLRTLLVDGQTFDVERVVVDESNEVTHFNWVSRPNEGYGFSCHHRRGDPLLSDDEMRRMARDCVADVNPETGFLD